MRHCRALREQLQELLGLDPGTGGRRKFGVSSWQDSRGHGGSCGALCLAAREPPTMSRQRPHLPASLCQKDRITTPRSGEPPTRGQLAACSLLLLPLLIQRGEGAAAEAVDELPKRQESGGCPAVPRRSARCHLAPAMRDGRGCPCWHLGAFLASLLGLGPVTGGGRLRLSLFCGRVGGCSARANAGLYRFPFLPLLNLDQHETKVLAEETSPSGRLFGAVSPASQQRAGVPSPARASGWISAAWLASCLPCAGRARPGEPNLANPASCASALLPTRSPTHVFHRPPPMVGKRRRLWFCRGSRRARWLRVISEQPGVMPPEVFCQKAGPGPWLCPGQD